MSPEARLFCGLTLILVPTIVYGGLTVLGVVSGRVASPCRRAMKGTLRG